MSGRPARLFVLAAIAGLAFGSMAPHRSLYAEPPAGGVALKPWEAEVERESATQTATIEQAKVTKTIQSVVSKYENRVFRDPSAINEYLLGRALYYAENPAAAKAAMERCLAAAPDFYYAHLRLAKLLLELKNLPDAEVHLRRVLASKPAHPEALSILAQIAMSRKDWKSARSWVNQRLAVDPADLAARHLLAVVCVNSKDWPAAKNELRYLLSRGPGNLNYRYMMGIVQLELGETDAGIAGLESVVHEQPSLLEALFALHGAYVKKEDWGRVRATLERMLPYLDEERRKGAYADIQKLKNGAPPPRTAVESRPKELTFDDLIRFVEDPNPVKREDALITIYDACVSGQVTQIPAKVLRRITSDIEPSDLARSTVVRILGTLAPEQVLPLLAVALYDESERVRMLAAEAIGGSRKPIGLAYLFPFLSSDGMSVSEYQSVRAALSDITGYVDLPAGTKAVATAADVAASRESWRRWRLSDASDPIKRAAVQQLIEYREQSAERFLYDFVLDPSFGVMSEAYRAMRNALARTPRDPVEGKTFPLFPSVPDADVTRANMRSLQDRVVAWWTNFVSERRAYLRASRPATPAPASGTPSK